MSAGPGPCMGPANSAAQSAPGGRIAARGIWRPAGPEGAAPNSLAQSPPSCDACGMLMGPSMKNPGSCASPAPGGACMRCMSCSGMAAPSMGPGPMGRGPCMGATSCHTCSKPLLGLPIMGSSIWPAGPKPIGGLMPARYPSRICCACRGSCVAASTSRESGFPAVEMPASLMAQPSPPKSGRMMSAKACFEGERQCSAFRRSEPHRLMVTDGPRVNASSGQ
mmetsp:Transcript_111832/g.311217  ORF Transcript_111832/g.311217 Transcript_111832/m.311217 type:complete len:222 (+) Transcript_111832:1792-2457(+)